MPNINYEEDTRHEVSDKVLRNLEKVSYDQDDFGMEKYNTPLHHSHKYGWLDMVDEELVDMLKYLQCEKDRKAQVIQLLEAALRVDNPKEYVQTAWELLTIRGTGK
ncbi:hypothetical protein [Cytobacillus oceanisediminis]|uniref:hypothetical protein n=1 Tax=Cytobacillus oceanisediminis TaxID=665099 RepID=UPI001C22FE34|nr:hypothetical protein [Cytobacillus oceanisediminis]MBU8770306.1 hypothetical protein [Cytobacillus oceanisediminis]